MQAVHRAAELHPRRGPQAAASWLHRRGPPPYVVGQSGRHSKGQLEASDVHRLHQPQ
jgi:hypothetical protein